MKIIKRLSLIAFTLLLIFMLWNFQSAPANFYIVSDSDFVFSKGNAPEATRSEVLQQLKRFQEGYTARDISKLDSFTEQLFSKDNIVIIGTLPKETMIGFKEAARLVENVWRRGIDFRFLMDNAQISTSGETAWFATIGTVKGHWGPAYYFLPLRASGVLAKEDGIWKFQQLHFQYDMNPALPFLVQFLLWGWLILNVILLGYDVYRRIRTRKKVDKAVEVSA